MVKKQKSENPIENTKEIILESISDGVFTVDHEWRIMSFNRAAEEITGIPREEAIGRHCWEVFRSNMCEGDCGLRRTMKQGKKIVNTSTYIINSKKQRIPIIAATSLLKNEKGEVLGGVETFQDLSLVEELRKELDSRFQMGDMVSRNSAMQKIFGNLPQMAESDSPILIGGETGTGKELLARAIHDLSPRKNEPFIAINCGALPDSLLESELFGYEAGAFTNANKNKPGRFAVAEGGTILLDEIGETSPAFQVKLLRVLEQGEFQPLGAVDPIQSNVRILAATNKNLTDLVDQEKFRQDLYYRINVVHLTLPPLRDRQEDIPVLVDYFIGRMNKLRMKTITGMDPEALKHLMNHHFPGNIRELENIIEHAFVLCGNGLITQDHLPASLISQKSPKISGSNNIKLDDTLKSTEAATIIQALERNHYNRLATAQELGMHKSTLFRKIKKLNITLPNKDGRSRH